MASRAGIVNLLSHQFTYGSRIFGIANHAPGIFQKQKTSCLSKIERCKFTAQRVQRNVNTDHTCEFSLRIQQFVCGSNHHFPIYREICLCHAYNIGRIGPLNIQVRVFMAQWGGSVTLSSELR